MTTYDSYNPPVAGELLVVMKELSNKERWGFYMYLIDNPDVTYEKMSNDTGIPIPELIGIQKTCYSCSQYVKFPCDIGDYNKSYLEVYPFMERMIRDILDSFYKPFTDEINWYKSVKIRMLPYYNNDVGEV